MPAESEALTLTERVRTAVLLGESHFREFKSAWDGPPDRKAARDPKLIRRDIGEALVAFANADGGELLVGVEDEGRITGVTHDAAIVDTFLSAWKTHVHSKTPLEPPRVARLDMDEHLVLYFAVEKGTELIHLTQDGRCLQRRDRESVPVPSEQIRFERQERISREYDRAFVDGGDASALNLDLLRRRLLRWPLLSRSAKPPATPHRHPRLLFLVGRACRPRSQRQSHYRNSPTNA